MKRILYVLHSGVTGGTFLTNKDLMKNVKNEFEVYLLGAESDFFILYKYSNDELSVIKKYSRHLNLNVPINGVNKEYNKWSVKEFHNSWLSFIYFDILVKFEIDIIHIRHLINHSFDLPQVAKKLDIPIVLSFHDFYFICPFYVLLNENNSYCGGVCNDNMENCYSPMSSLNDINSKEFILKWRTNVCNLFQYINYFVTTSEIVMDLFKSIYYNYSIFNKDNFVIIEHGRDFPKLNNDYFEIPSKKKPIKILCLANHLNIMKGSELIKEIKNADYNNMIEFHFLGNCHDGLEDYGVVHGNFERDELYKKIYDIKPSFVGIFSIWPETFCHTLTESWSCKIPVIGTNIGVIKERILKNNGGWIIDIENPTEIFDLLNHLSEDKEEYLKMVENIDNINLKNTKSMSEEYIQIYNELLSKKLGNG